MLQIGYSLSPHNFWIILNGLGYLSMHGCMHKFKLNYYIIYHCFRSHYIITYKLSVWSFLDISFSDYFSDNECRWMESMEKTRTTLSLMPPLLGHDQQLFFVILSSISTGESWMKKKIAWCASVSLYDERLLRYPQGCNSILFCSPWHNATMTDKWGVEVVVETVMESESRGFFQRPQLQFCIHKTFQNRWY